MQKWGLKYPTARYTIRTIEALFFILSDMQRDETGVL